MSIPQHQGEEMSNLLSYIPGLSKAPVTVPSVSAILESFHTVVSQLEDAASAHQTLALQHAQAAQEAMTAKAASEGEVVAALTAVQNIRALIGTKV
jgi:hypothetical protein